MDEYKTVRETCPYCLGTGKGTAIPIFPFILMPPPCWNCNGTGYVEKRVKK